jgi:hypothetical protein
MIEANKNNSLTGFAIDRLSMMVNLLVLPIFILYQKIAFDRRINDSNSSPANDENNACLVLL